jgi:predicted small lipoprotein YifL
MRTLAAAASLVLLAACGDSGPPAGDPAPADAAAVPTAPSDAPAVPGQAPSADGEQGGAANWRQVVSAADAANLGRLDEAWRLGRAEAEDKGFAGKVEALGPLVDPNAGQTGRLQPAPGAYRCRTIKLGSQSPDGLAYVEYPWFRCSVELTPGGDLILTKTTGSQRTRGLLYPDTDDRLVFIGAQAWGMNETAVPRYGDQSVRDQVGVFERIGSNRWRLVIPWPKVESKLEILELAR